MQEFGREKVSIIVRAAQKAQGTIYKAQENKMDNTLSKRAFRFASSTISFLREIPYSKEGEVIKAQLIRSATSVGANYEEAQGAFSRNDFKYKVSICLREINETNYWLRIIKETNIYSGEDIDILIKESYELKNIFGSILKKMTTHT